MFYENAVIQITPVTVDTTYKTETRGTPVTHNVYYEDLEGVLLNNKGIAVEHKNVAITEGNITVNENDYIEVKSINGVSVMFKERKVLVVNSFFNSSNEQYNFLSGTEIYF